MENKKALEIIFGESDFNEAVNDAAELGREISNALSDGYKNALYQSDISVRRAFNTRYQAIKYQLEFGVISENEYYEKLESIRDAYFSKNSIEWYKYTEEIYEYRLNSLKSYEDAIKAHFGTIAQSGEKMLGEIEKAREKYQEKLFDFAGNKEGFKTKKVTIENYYPNGGSTTFYEHTLSDLSDDVKELQEFNDSLNNLKARASELGVQNFGDFFDEMRNLSVEDASILSNLLLQANDKKFVKYFENYEQKKELTEQIAGSLYSEDYSKAALEMKAEIEKSFSSIPEDFFNLGETTAENFKEGFIAEIKDLFLGVSQILSGQGISLSLSADNTGESKNYVSTYNFYGNGETVSSQLIAAQNHSALEKLRGNV